MSLCPPAAPGSVSHAVQRCGTLPKGPASDHLVPPSLHYFPQDLSHTSHCHFTGMLSQSTSGRRQGEELVGGSHNCGKPWSPGKVKPRALCPVGHKHCCASLSLFTSQSPQGCHRKGRGVFDLSGPTSSGCPGQAQAGCMGPGNFHGNYIALLNKSG